MAIDHIFKAYGISPPIIRARATQVNNQGLHRHSNCNRCGQNFPASEILRAHKELTNHCYCRECHQIFRNVKLHLAHVREKRHKVQYECCDCGREYLDHESLTTHCCACDRVFHTKEILDQHSLTSIKHKARVARVKAEQRQKKRYECPTCDKGFGDHEALAQHERDKHNISKKLACPSTQCRKRFAQPSALLDHLESGKCKSKMNRQTLNQLVILHDTDHHITNKDAASMIGGAPDPLQQASLPGNLPSTINTSDESSEIEQVSQDSDDESVESFGGVSLSPSPDIDEHDYDIVRTPSPDDNVSGWSMISCYRGRSLDGISSTNSDFQMSRILTPPPSPSPSKKPLEPYCPLCLRIFKSMLALQMHQNSPAHAPKIFHCPVAFIPDDAQPNARKKRKDFSTLSGLTRHLEAGACRGGTTTMENALKFVEERLSQLGLGGIKLLGDSP